MSKKNEEAPTVSTPSLQITKVKITSKDEVTLEARERIYVSPNGADDEASVERFMHHTVSTDIPPHEDFLKAFQGLRRFAMAMAEFNRKDIPLVNTMTVGEMRIAGEQEKQNSRVDFTIMKWIKRTGKGIAINTGQSVMYGKGGEQGSIPDMVEMTKAIDLVIAEAWEYINGKNGAGVKIQLAFKYKKAS